MVNEEVKEFLKRRLEKYAEENDLRLNPDKKRLNWVLEALIKNFERYNYFYCPCRVEHTRDNICPCTHFKKEVEENGHCLCMLFYKR